MYPVRRQISPHAARLRHDRTDCENRVWQALRNRQCEGFKFRFQASLEPYIVDFLCIEVRLIVELDGGQHAPEGDAARTAHLETRGYRVLRFWNSDVVENLEGVLEAIRLALIDRVAEKKKTRPQPASGEQRPALFRSCRGHDRPDAPAKAGGGFKEAR